MKEIMELTETLRKIEAWRDQAGEIDLFCYKFRGNYRVDVHVDDGGRFINSKGSSIQPYRKNISEIIKDIYTEIERRENPPKQSEIF